METLLTAVVLAFALIAIGYGAARLKILGPAIFPALNGFPQPFPKSIGKRWF